MVHSEFQGHNINFIANMEPWQKANFVQTHKPILNIALRTVVFPDYSVTGQGLIPTGTTTEFDIDNLDHVLPKLSGADIGCGISYAFFETTNPIDFIDQQKLLNAFYQALKQDKGTELGGGNHFIDFIELDGRLGIVVHTGSPREMQAALSKLSNNPDRYFSYYPGVISSAEANRAAIIRLAGKVLQDKTDPIINTVHNTINPNRKTVLVHKGTVDIPAKDSRLLILPSSMEGDMLFYKVGIGIVDALYSISHGTGRKYSRAATKDMVSKGSFKLPRVLTPTGMPIPISEYPEGYNTIKDVLPILLGAALIQTETIKTATPLAYIGHI